MPMLLQRLDDAPCRCIVSTLGWMAIEWRRHELGDRQCAFFLQVVQHIDERKPDGFALPADGLNERGIAVPQRVEIQNQTQATLAGRLGEIGNRPAQNRCKPPVF